jgi:hypothetical protein
MTAHLHLVPRSRMVELYLHFHRRVLSLLYLKYHNAIRRYITWVADCFVKYITNKQKVKSYWSFPTCKCVNVHWLNSSLLSNDISTAQTAVEWSGNMIMSFEWVRMWKGTVATCFKAFVRVNLGSSVKVAGKSAKIPTRYLQNMTATSIFPVMNSDHCSLQINFLHRFLN